MAGLDVRYQAFVSSTYRDLARERQQVIQALLELDAIPSGMELFPAADDDQWTLIKKVIDECDYYILIVGGRYGSTTTEGVSYTEKEFDYAVSCGKPILAFPHANPDELSAKNTELAPELRERLAAFRKKVETGRVCRYWSTAEELGGLVSRSLVKITRDKPAEGWVRGRHAAGPELLIQMNALRDENEKLRSEIAASRFAAPEDAKQYVGGADEFEIFGIYKYWSSGTQETTWQTARTWDEIFSCVGPLMYDECSEHRMSQTLASQLFERDADDPKPWGNSVELAADIFQTIKIQLLALGLITKSERKRGTSDRQTYWKLTPYGETYLLKLRALRRQNAAPEGAEEKVGEVT